MRRTLYESDHDAFRDTVRTFLAKEVTPHHARWEGAGVVDRDVWLAAGRAWPSGSAWGRTPAWRGSPGWSTRG